MTTETDVQVDELRRLRPAILSTLTFLRSRNYARRCDSQAVADCERCKTMFLVRTLEHVMGAEPVEARHV